MGVAEKKDSLLLLLELFLLLICHLLEILMRDVLFIHVKVSVLSVSGRLLSRPDDESREAEKALRLNPRFWVEQRNPLSVELMIHIPVHGAETDRILSNELIGHDWVVVKDLKD